MLAAASKTNHATRMTIDAIVSAKVVKKIALRCPRCRTHVSESDCPECGFHFRNIKGIVYALPPERIVHFARFVDEYERIRKAEGRGSDGDEYYLGLPYSDSSRRNSAQWGIRARSFDCLLGRILKPLVAPGGQILDIGAGNCWMSYRLALAGFSPCGVDLITNDGDGLGAAEHYRNYLPAFFPRFRAEFTRLPFEDLQFDAVVFNASLHYAEDIEAAIEEALRCCKHGGVVAVCDTPWYSNDESGRMMVSERRAMFLQKYGTESSSLGSQEYLTDARLKVIEQRLGIQWTNYTPQFGLKWALRPIMARIRRRREPARFRIYVARKAM